MESSVKHSDLRGLGHDSLAGTDAHQVCGVVEGSQGDALLNGLDDLVIDDAGLGELHAAVQDAVADSIDLVGGLDDTVLGINQDLQDSGNCLGMGGHGDVPDDLLVADLVGQTAVDINTLTQALSGNHAGIRIHQLILQAGAACVDNQNVHWDCPPKSFLCFLFLKNVV